jgi:hypothetical protein
VAPLGQQREKQSKPASQSTSGRRRGRLRAAFASSFTGQAVAAVALAHGLLLPLFSAGVLSGVAYALLALALSCTAIAVIGRRISRSVAALRAALTRFRDGRAEPALRLGAGKAAAESTELVSLQRGLENMYRRVAKREQRLKAAYEAAESESAASRSLAQRLARTERIARIGNWEWTRAIKMIHSGGYFYPVNGVTATTIRLIRRSILRK